ncbi:MAG: radical SAM protein [Nitrospinota bacterium]
MKKIKKIIFVEPKPPDYHVFSRMPLPRLGTILLGTILKDAGYEVKSYIEEFAELDIEDLLSADAIGISTITSTAPRAFEIARQVKKRGIPVFMGGAHVTYMPDEALEYCDYVLRGECDDTIIDFVKTIEKGEGFERISGLSYKVGNEIRHNNIVSLFQDMDKLPIPDYSIVKGLENDICKKMGIVPISTSRGCPYDCNFCSVTGMFGHKFRFRSTDKVLEELRMLKKAGAKWVFFYDDNFTAHKGRAKELLTAMIKNGLTPKWTAQVSVDVAKDLELVSLMKKSNCSTVYIGFESINPATLKAYNKKQSVNDIEKCIDTLHKNGINIHGMFVFGSDEDTIDTIHETLRFAKKNNIETVQFLILTPLPGTRLYDELEKQGRIYNKDWSLYDAHHVVYEPKKMTIYELQSETLKAMNGFYSLGQILKRVVKFQMLTISLKAYGRHLTRTWIKRNKYFVDYTKSMTQAGKIIDLAAKKTAEDVKLKFGQPEWSSKFTHSQSH